MVDVQAALAVQQHSNIIEPWKSDPALVRKVQRSNSDSCLQVKAQCHRQAQDKLVKHRLPSSKGPLAGHLPLGRFLAAMGVSSHSLRVASVVKRSLQCLLQILLDRRLTWYTVNLSALRKVLLECCSTRGAPQARLADARKGSKPSISSNY